MGATPAGQRERRLNHTNTGPGRDTPDGLTAPDAAYLTALYMSDPEGKKNMEQTDISIRMADILINANMPAR